MKEKIKGYLSTINIFVFTLFICVCKTYNHSTFTNGPLCKNPFLENALKPRCNRIIAKHDPSMPLLALNGKYASTQSIVAANEALMKIEKKKKEQVDKIKKEHEKDCMLISVKRKKSATRTSNIIIFTGNFIGRIEIIRRIYIFDRELLNTYSRVITNLIIFNGT
ncbi:nucleosomal binding protein 1 [Plasmodium vivax North Korean]|uniref:Nucleosomal binding protein 1 n=1 Tax=Plasmodium vivax North Korean TaxID=1035514 RepID=A0A0J9U2W7_PLAVI|nr:nucleosomal binding protein 1 [Plasmodium vivax North Korean]